MSLTGASDTQHAELMNAIYRRQRWIYDASRKYFLFGRDHMIRELAPPEGGSVLELGCGTGRNLALVARHYPGRALYGLDISSEMLTSARAALGAGATLAEADACAFDAEALFGRARFDRVFLSYAVSMIPDWRAALRAGAEALAEGGELHVVDFGTQQRLGRLIRGPLNAWLGKFHVSPRQDLCEALNTLAEARGGHARCTHLYRDYAQHGVLVAD